VETYDYVIVGAGSSGCVLANRLSADPKVRVLLLEAGGSDRHPLIAMPRGFGRILADPRFVWTYRVDKGGGANSPEYWVRGKALGGSSSVNGMVYVRGLKSDYDDWEAQGCAGWGWKDLGPCFQAIEDHALGEGEGRGVGGPLRVTPHPHRQPLCEAMTAAAGELGLPVVEDLNALDAPGFGYQPRTIFRGRRQSAALAFLRPAMRRPNLRVMTGAEALRIEFDDRRATGVRLRTPQGETVVRAGREVILAVGALHSPKLLQLSGVGPVALLRRHGIEVVAASEDVGGNMREHRLLALQFRVRGESQNRDFSGLGLAASVLKYALFRSGALSSAAFEVGGFVKTRPELARPDAQLGMGPISMDRTRPGFVMERHPGALCGGYPMRPESRGTVEITGSDPDAPLSIRPNYLSAEADRATSIGILRFIRRLYAQPALRRFVVEETWPGPGVERDDEILEAFHRIGQAGYHAAGTCRMGADAGSVVDTRLKVRGVEGLRVADISVMPSLVSGNTNAPAMAMAWRAADLIAEDARCAR
jgi:choline dehydrogenase